jgi:hypothetical protein
MTHLCPLTGTRRTLPPRAGSSECRLRPAMFAESGRRESNPRSQLEKPADGPSSPAAKRKSPVRGHSHLTVRIRCCPAFAAACGTESRDSAGGTLWHGTPRSPQLCKLRTPDKPSIIESFGADLDGISIGTAHARASSRIPKTGRSGRLGFEHQLGL